MDPRQQLRAALANRDKAIADAYDAIANAVRAGMAVNDVAAESGYHRNHVARICRERGVPDARRRRQADTG